jgi:hypothetical protein
MDAMGPIEEALAELPADERAAAAGPVLVDRVVDALGLDEDDVNAATRRGLLLAAAEGNPIESCEPGSRAALETATDLTEQGYGAPLAAALGDLGRALPADVPLVAAAVNELQADSRLALEALAVVLLHRALAAS